MSVPEILSPQSFSHEVLAGKIFSSTEAAKPARGRLQGYPSHLDADFCWTRSDIQAEQYLIQLSAEDIVAIENAMEGFKSLQLPMFSLDPCTFVLPTELAGRLRVISKTVHSGTGFAVIRGINPQQYSEEENAIIYSGIASHMGIRRSATSHGMAMGHIRDATYNAKPKNIADGEELAPSKQKGGMKFHADSMYADILSLYRNPSDTLLPTTHAKSQAAIGGERCIHNSWKFMRKLMSRSKVLPVFRGDPHWAETRQPSTIQNDHHPGQHKGPQPFIVQTQLWPNDPLHQRIPARSCLGSLGQNFALVSVLIASSYGISRYCLQETTLKDGSGGNIFDAVAAWGPSPLQFYCSCGIWTVAVVLWFHKHGNSERRTLILAVGILSAICIGATLNMSLEQMGRQVMPWCVVLSAVVDSVLRELLRIPVLEHYEDAPSV